MKRVSPWLVELVSSIPAIHLASFSPPRKKPRIPAYPEFPFEGQLLNPAFPPNPLSHGHHYGLHKPHPSFFPFPDGSAPAAIQGARHAQFVPPLPDLHFTHLQSSLLYPGLRRSDQLGRPTPPAPARISTDLSIGGGAPARDDVSCTLSIGADKNPKPAGLVLFGRTILIEQQMSLSTSSGGATSPAASLNWNADKGPNASDGSGSGSGSGSGVTQNSPTKNVSSERRLPWFIRDGSQSSSELLVLEPGQCKVFVESDTVGRNLDLSALGSFDELYGRLSEMFCIESSELRSRVLYRGATGGVKHVGDEPFR